MKVTSRLSLPQLYPSRWFSAVKKIGDMMNELNRNFLSKVIEIILILVYCLLVIGCSDKTTDSETIQWVFKLSRTRCYGVCPIYSLEISSNGMIKYEGIKYVTLDTTITLQISEKTIQELYNLFKASDYFSFDTTYVNISMTDMPSVITSLKFGNKNKRIEHYLGDLNAPPELSDLEITVEEILETVKFTGVNPSSNYPDYP